MMKHNNNYHKSDSKKASSQLSYNFLEIFHRNINILTSILVLSIALILFLVFNSPNASSSSLIFPFTYFSTTSSLQAKSTDTDIMAQADVNENWKHAKTIYEFKAKDIDGNEIDLSKYKGRVVLIVNVACNCGFTSGNYPQMQELHRKYEKEGLSVLAFPCNQFGGQEPKPEAEIKEFVKQFNVEFDMFSKVNVNGDAAHPLYKFLKSKVDGTLGNFIKWNFSKFLINRDGVPVKRYSPTTEPKSIEKDIVELLNNRPAL